MDESENTGYRNPFSDLTNSSTTMCRTPLAELTNLTNTGNNASGVPTQIMDPKERKRQREKERYANMTCEEREERSRKQRESRQKRKARQTVDQENIIQKSGEAMPQCGDIGGHNVEINLSNTLSGGDDSFREHRQTIDPIESRRQYKREWYAKMTDEQREERNKKQRESRQRKKAQAAHNADDGCRPNVENMSPGKNNEWLHRNDTYRRVVQNRVRVRKHREKKRTTLNKDSLAMENPMYVDEVAREPLTVDGSHSQESILTPDSAMPEVNRTPVCPQSTSDEMENPFFVPKLVWDSPAVPETPCSRLTHDFSIPELITGTPVRVQSLDAEMPDANVGLKSHRRHVTHGERRSLLSRRNKEFEANIARRSSSNTEDGVECNDEDDDNQGHSESQSVANDTGDDEGVIFEEDDEEEEGYLFAGQDEEHDDDVEISDPENDSTSMPVVPDPYDKVYSNIPTDTHSLKPVANCQHCDAKRFEYEPQGFCCRDGKVHLSTPEVPPELMRLWSSADSDAKHFRDNIRFFNGHFSFSSLYAKLDNSMTDVRNSGIYTFRAHGQIYHNIRSFARDGTEPRHLELYFYDDDPSLEQRMHSCRRERYEKDKEVIEALVGILRGNPYSNHLRRLGQIEDLDNYRVELNLDQRLDQRTYNVPITTEVAAVWVEGSEFQGQFRNSVMLHGKNRDIHGIRSYHGCYDPLSYPLFFPRGELGWHCDIPKVGVSMEAVLENRAKRKASRENDEDDPDSPGNLCVSVRDYYCYKFQMRPGVFNPVLYGKRLFQQFAVDTYIKVESSRLDFQRNNQTKIRADLYQGLVDSLHAGEGRACAVGKRTVLPTSFIGGPRDMRRRYMDAMALVRKFGKPDIFLTMTCNPNWDEIKRELYFGQIPQDRPDLIVRVFRAKLEEMKKRLFKYDILGKVRAYLDMDYSKDAKQPKELETTEVTLRDDGATQVDSSLDDKEPGDHETIEELPEDYVCTDRDHLAIDLIKTSPENKILVDINDVCVKKKDMNSLLNQHDKLPGEVLNAYIRCMRAQAHLQNRADGNAYLEDTFISGILKRDGKIELTKEDMKTDTFVQRLKTI
ncbi:hypothetical protein ACP70R_018647 [Stipagrostis hirtigluma subsp. patula]